MESKVNDAFNTFKKRIAGLWKKVTGKETLKDIVEDEAKKEQEEDHEQQQENIDLTPKEHEQALSGAI